MLLLHAFPIPLFYMITVFLLFIVLLYRGHLYITGLFTLGVKSCLILF